MLLTVRILEHYVTIIPPNNVSWIFQVFENTPCIQWFVNTLAKGIQGEEDKNIVAEYSDVELVTDLKSQSGKNNIDFNSKAKFRGEWVKYFHH